MPPAPGVLSALGLLVSNLKSEFARTALQRPPDYDLAVMAGVFADLDAQAQAWLAHEGVPPEGCEVRWLASLRYVHQGFELTVPWAAKEVSAASVAATIAAFHRLHERLYTFAQEDTPVEIVTLRASAVGRLPRPQPSELPKGGSDADARIGRQDADFGAGPQATPIYDRARLGAGAKLRGPAILTQLDTTTVLYPGQVAETDRYGCLIVQEG